MLHTLEIVLEFLSISALTSHVNVKIALWQAGGSVSRVPEKLLGDWTPRGHGISSSTEREHTVTVPRRYLDDVVVVFSGWQQLFHGRRSKICLMSNYSPKIIPKNPKRIKNMYINSKSLLNKMFITF